MKKHITLFITLVLLLTSCVDVSSQQQGTATPAAPLFVTSTLPPTKQALTIPTDVPPTATATLDPSVTRTPDPASNCRDSAALVEDVTYPDNAIVPTGETFTKIWKLQNNGNCKWTGYTVAFVDGDRMASPDSVPVPETDKGNPVEVSVDLTAPSIDGTYHGNFELRNADGKTVPVGNESVFWVQITVGSSQAGQVGNCVYTTNSSYVQQLIDLINKARADVGRAELTVNDKLMSAAQAHSLDMACKDFLKHSGSDGSWTGDRLTKAGYTNPYYLELLAIGLPGDAINQWKIHPKLEWELVINSRVTEIGVGYVYNKFSSYGGYWTVDMGGP
ncbi:MAG: hypothetical protein IPP66_10950 [Anaerolineales bacterium]|nr:hypothetical protein [Anaerolineales bacterium]